MCYHHAINPTLIFGTYLLALGISVGNLFIISSLKGDSMTYTYHVFKKVNGFYVEPYSCGVFSPVCHNGSLILDEEKRSVGSCLSLACWRRYVSCMSCTRKFHGDSDETRSC